MADTAALERVLKRDRLIAVAALSVIIAASWAYVLAGAGMGMSAFEMSSLSMALGQPSAMPMAEGMKSMAGDMASTMDGAMQAMATPVAWTADYAVLMFFMWWIMMIAMMLPSAAPMILLHAAVTRKSSRRPGAAGAPWATGTFTLGYLLVWAMFSAVAVALQCRFEAAGVLSPMMLKSTNALFAAGILLFAGVYQLTPLKQACLIHCRGPVHFLTRHWRPRAGGAFAMGLHHGVFCLGCCWGLMAVLFFGGIMNLYWIIGLALIVLAEKIFPSGPWIGRVTGVALLVAAAFMLASAAGGSERERSARLIWENRMPNTDWYIEGIEFGNCNCNYGCPCQFEDKPTHGNCRGFEVLQIERGHFGDVKLDGLRCAVLYAWPGPIFEGKGELQAIIDEGASPEQRDALEKVLHGKETEEAKTHWWVFNAMSDMIHPTLFKPIDFEVDLQGRTARISIPEILEATGRPIRSPATGDSHRVQISIPDGIEFEVAEIGSASTRRRRRSGLIWTILMGSGTSCGTRALAWCINLHELALQEVLIQVLD